jgi:hypothetical protein
VAGAVVLFGALAWDRVRVDTPVTATLQGEGGCAVAATFTDPTGAVREVDLRPWRGQCTKGEPGEQVTVWYDASDPSVTAPNDRWWWPALVAVAPVLVVVGLARGRGRPRPRPSDAGSGPPAREVRATPAPSVGILHRGGADAHLVHDYAVGRLEVLADRVRSTGGDAAVVALMEEARQRLVEGDVSGAEQCYREVLRRVEPWRSGLGDDLRGYGRNIFG